MMKNEFVTEELGLEELIFDFHESAIYVLLQTSNVGMMLTITDKSVLSRAAVGV